LGGENKKKKSPFFKKGKAPWGNPGDFGGKKKPIPLKNHPQIK